MNNDTRCKTIFGTCLKVQYFRLKIFLDNMLEHGTHFCDKYSQNCKLKNNNLV